MKVGRDEKTTAGSMLIVSVGKTKDGEDVSGSISVPEVAHDTERDEYVVRFFII